MRVVSAKLSLVLFAVPAVCWMPTASQGDAAQTSPQPDTIAERFPPPPGFRRVGAERGSFGAWLGTLPLLPANAPVRLYPVVDGRLKGRQDVHAAVVDMGVLRYQECADAVIRLRAEYLWTEGRARDICFEFTSGDTCCWARWREGWRPAVSANRVTWSRSAAPDSSKAEFLEYLDTVMKYAGTASLSRELPWVSPENLRAGDVIIEGGFPGHAVLILDVAENDRDERRMLLGQSFMPAQQFHVLKNPRDAASPWYRIPVESTLSTPEWAFDISRHCRRFRSAD